MRLWCVVAASVGEQALLLMMLLCCLSVDSMSAGGERGAGFEGEVAPLVVVVVVAVVAVGLLPVEAVLVGRGASPALYNVAAVGVRPRMDFGCSADAAQEAA